MDYAIYKTIDGRSARPVHRFTQHACNHHAKRAAKEKLQQMWLHILGALDFYKNARGTDSEFSYELPTATNATMQIRFYIDIL